MKRPSLQTCRLKRGTEMYQSLDCKKKKEPNEKPQNNPHVHMLRIMIIKKKSEYSKFQIEIILFFSKV